MFKKLYKSILIVLVVTFLSTQMTSCQMPKKVFGAAGGIFNAVFGNEGLICQVPLISNLAVKLLGGCQITHVVPPNVVGGVGPNGSNWTGVVDIIPDPISVKKTLDVDTICYIHLWDELDGTTTVVRSAANEVPAGKPRYGCADPKISLTPNDGTAVLIFDINKNNADDLTTFVYNYNSNSAVNNYVRVYAVEAFCDGNGNDRFDGNEDSLQSNNNVKITVDYKWVPENPATVDITQNKQLKVIWKNTDKLINGGQVAGCNNVGDPIVVKPVAENVAIRANTICYIHMWDINGNGNKTTVVKSTKDEIPAGKPRYGCDAPKVEMKPNDGSGRKVFNINKNNRDSLNNMILKYNSNAALASYRRVYDVTAYCDKNGNNVYDGGELLLQRNGGVKMTVDYKFNLRAPATVDIKQNKNLSVIWRNSDRLRRGGTVPGCDALADPLVVDLFGNGFKFERVQKSFDYDVDGIKEKWYGIKSTKNDDAFIVLDIDGDKKITSGRELFGNYTTHYLVPKDKSCRPDRSGRVCKFFKRPWKKLPAEGFQALAIYDKAFTGGNGDGWIDSRDAIYPYLKLWVQDVDDSHVIGRNLVPISLFGMRIQISGYTEMSEVDSRTLNKTRFRSRVLMSNPPMRLKESKSGKVFDVKETVVADIWFNVL